MEKKKSLLFNKQYITQNYQESQHGWSKFNPQSFWIREDEDKKYEISEN